MPAPQQIEDDLTAEDIGTAELAEILREFHREPDPQAVASASSRSCLPAPHRPPTASTGTATASCTTKPNCLTDSVLLHL